MQKERKRVLLVSIQQCPCGCTHEVHTRTIAGTAKGLTQCRNYFLALGAFGRKCLKCGDALHRSVVLLPPKNDR